MNKTVFLDRDGTINVDFGYVYKIGDLKFIDGAVDGLKILNDLGYKLIIITNQSGVGRGFYTENDLKRFNENMIEQLRKQGIMISKVYYCPHISSDNCNCRKPKLELFYKAIKDFDIDINNSFAIGDKERDLSICSKESIKGILLTESIMEGYICKKNLLEAAKYIKEISGSDV